mgnify:CR=1 FL=1
MVWEIWWTPPLITKSKKRWRWTSMNDWHQTKKTRTSQQWVLTIQTNNEQILTTTVNALSKTKFFSKKKKKLYLDVNNIRSLLMRCLNSELSSLHFYGFNWVCVTFGFLLKVLVIRSWWFCPTQNSNTSWFGYNFDDWSLDQSLFLQT